ncbi:MAG: carbon-nitrogen hydrolase family protein [Bacteroidota bacterium]
MKICLAQTYSFKGEVQKNIENHLRMVKQAIASQASLIIFPELSLTGYEPELAKELAVAVDNEIFQPFQALADQHSIVIGAGMPTLAPDGINISMLIFQPQADRTVYSKRILHADELPYFVSGTHQPFLHIQGLKIGLGICYETLQREHFIHAVTHEAQIYIASVAKPDRGVDKAYLHFPSIAQEFGIPILMANCVGFCDNFMSNGKSSVWNREGKLIGQLDEENQGLLIYDTESV